MDKSSYGLRCYRRNMEKTKIGFVMLKPNILIPSYGKVYPRFGTMSGKDYHKVLGDTKSIKF